MAPLPELLDALLDSPDVVTVDAVAVCRRCCLPLAPLASVGLLVATVEEHLSRCGAEVQ